jgi:hypothetical protein
MAHKELKNTSGGKIIKQIEDKNPQHGRERKEKDMQD